MYSEAERLRRLKPRTLDWARVVGANERGHVKAIRGLLGRDAFKSPKFNFRGVTEDDASSRRLPWRSRTSRPRCSRRRPPRSIRAAWWRRSCRSTPSRRATRPGSGTSPGSSRPPTPSTSRRRRPRSSAGRVHELRHRPRRGPREGGDPGTRGERRGRMRRSELGAALALAGVLIGAAVAVVLVAGSSGPSSAEPPLPPSPRSALAPKNVALGPGSGRVLGARARPAPCPGEPGAAARWSARCRGERRRGPRTSCSSSGMPSAVAAAVGRGGPGIPDDARGWVPRSALGGYTPVRTRLVVDRARLTATLLRGRRVVFRARVGVGTPATPTPGGRLLRPQSAPPLPEPVLRTDRLRHQRPLDRPQRLAGRRLRRHPRDQPTRT